MRTALDLQMEETLDLAELAEALVAAGFRDPSRTTTRWIGFAYGEGSEAGWFSWRVADENGNVAFVFRDAVRKIAPGSYCIPTPVSQPQYPPLRVELRSAWGLHAIANDGESYKTSLAKKGLPRMLFGATETECWARALVALYRAGLLGSVAS